ncbi:MAG: hypothetical protein AABX79_02790 [Nanoarchaeota archaeon]
MIIGLNLDGVLAEMMPPLNDFYNRRTGNNFRVRDYKYHDLERTWGCSKQKAVRIVENFYQSPNFLKIRPMPRAQQGIWFLSANHRFFSITSRPESTRAITEDFIKRNFGSIIKKVIHTGQYASAASSINKFDICVQEKAGALIEDCLETAIDSANRGLFTFLLDCPYNQFNGEVSAESIPKNLVRVGSWQKIMEILK